MAEDATNTAGITPEKCCAFDVIDRNAKAIALTCDNIFYFGELGNQEYESAALMSGLLEKEGFTVERGMSGFPTSFLATYGSGSPVIAIHTEFDANPDNSQQPGIAEPKAIVENAPGHCEGHNVNAAVLIAGAIAIKRTMEQHATSRARSRYWAPPLRSKCSRAPTSSAMAISMTSTSPSIPISARNSPSDMACNNRL